MSTSNPTDFNKRLGAAVRSRRVALGLSQSNVGQALGITFQQVQKYERGVNRLSVETFVRLTELLKTTPQELIDAASIRNAPMTEDSPRDEMGDRMRLETMRRLSALSAERQRIAHNIIKTLSKEEAA